ncbi:MAG: sigma-70 family RNA polymerase sigma factor [Sphingobacteriaceae bacterium]|nr:sigma-70 family RNA polymerase sigma factor [Sphingobacteriaceae bacterium]
MAQLSKYKDHSDSQLINNFLESGDNVFVGELYKRYGHLVLGLCIKYLKDKDEAEDAVMTIFGQLLNDLKKHKVEYFKSWLYTYSKNYCLMQLRKKQNQLKKELDVKENEIFLMDYNNIEHLNEKEQQISIMQSALSELNKEQKECLELFYLSNKSYTEIVTITGYNNNEVKSHIQNGKRNLKLKMEAKLNGQANR